MYTDTFEGIHADLTFPAESGEAIVPNDNEDIEFLPRAIHAGSDGTIRGIFKNSDAPVDLVVRAGVAYPYRLKRVLSTGTTATGLVGML